MKNNHNQRRIATVVEVDHKIHHIPSPRAAEATRKRTLAVREARARFSASAGNALAAGLIRAGVA